MRRERENTLPLISCCFELSSKVLPLVFYLAFLFFYKASQNTVIIPQPTSHQALVHTLSVIQNMARLPVFLGVCQKKRKKKKRETLVGKHYSDLLERLEHLNASRLKET